MTHYTSDSIIPIAQSCARGCYQLALLRGEQRWSGADLRGKAGKWGRLYARSRSHLLRRITQAGLSWRLVYGPHQRHDIEIGRRCRGSAVEPHLVCAREAGHAK